MQAYIFHFSQPLRIIQTTTKIFKIEVIAQTERQAKKRLERITNFSTIIQPVVERIEVKPRKHQIEL